MQDAVKFPRSSRTSDLKTSPNDAPSPEVRARENPEIKISLERPESIEALKSTRAARGSSSDDIVVRPLAARELGAVPTDEAETNVAPLTTRAPGSQSDDASIHDALADALQQPDEGTHAEPTSTSIVTREPFKAMELLTSFGLILVTGASLLFAGWSYASMQDLRGQLAMAAGEKTSSVQALAQSQSRLAVTEKALAEAQSRLSIAEKALAGVKAALVAAAAPTPGASAGTTK
jgi:hypothetical protein